MSGLFGGQGTALRLDTLFKLLKLRSEPPRLNETVPVAPPPPSGLPHEESVIDREKSTALKRARRTGEPENRRTGEPENRRTGEPENFF